MKGYFAETNLDSEHSAPARIAHEVAGLYDPKLAPLQPIEDKELEVTKFFRALMEKVAAGRADPEDFAPEVRASFFPEGVKEWEKHLVRVKIRGAVGSHEIRMMSTLFRVA